MGNLNESQERAMNVERSPSSYTCPSQDPFKKEEKDTPIILKTVDMDLHKQIHFLKDKTMKVNIAEITNCKTV